MIDVDTYRVDIERTMETTISVRMTTNCYLQLSGGRSTHEWTIVQVCSEILVQERLDLLRSDLDIDALINSHPCLIRKAKARLGNLD